MKVVIHLSKKTAPFRFRFQLSHCALECSPTKTILIVKECLVVKNCFSYCAYLDGWYVIADTNKEGKEEAFEGICMGPVPSPKKWLERKAHVENVHLSLAVVSSLELDGSTTKTA